MRKLFRPLAIVMMTLVVLTACSKKEATTTTTPGEKVSGKVLIYTSIYPDIIEGLKPILKSEFPDLEIEFFQAGSEKIIAKLAAEIEAGGIQADLLMIADPAYYNTLKGQKLLTKYVSKNSEGVPNAIKDPDGFFTGVRISNMIIAYNTSSVNPQDAPTKWADLTNKKWKGAVAMPNPLLSGSAFDAVAALSQSALGWQYFDALKANGVKVLDGNSAVEKALAAGEYKVGMILEENILKAKAAGSPVDIAYPSEGIVSIPSPIAITSTTKNLKGSKAVEDFILSDKGQNLMVTGWMHSVKPKATAPKGSLLKSDDLPAKAFKIDWVALATQIDSIKAEFSKRVLE